MALEGAFKSDKGETMVVPTEDERESMVAIAHAATQALERAERKTEINSGTMRNMISNDATHFCMLANSEFAMPAATILMAKMAAIPEYKDAMTKENPLVVQMIQGWAEEAERQRIANEAAPQVKTAPLKPTEFERDASDNLFERSNRVADITRQGAKIPDAALKAIALEDSKDFERVSSHPKLRQDALIDIGFRMEEDKRYKAMMTEINPKLVDAAEMNMAQNIVESARKWAGEKLQGVMKLAEKIGFAAPAAQAPLKPAVQTHAAKM